MFCIVECKVCFVLVPLVCTLILEQIMKYVRWGIPTVWCSIPTSFSGKSSTCQGGFVTLWWKVQKVGNYPCRVANQHHTFCSVGSHKMDVHFTMIAYNF